MKLNKKGQVMENLGGLAIGVVAFAIIIVIAFMIMTQGKTTAVGLIETTTYTDETKTIPNNTVVSFRNCVDTENMVITGLKNCSIAACVTVGSANYSATKNTMTVAFYDSINGYNGTLTNVSYTCKVPSYAYNSTKTLQSATDGIPGYIPVIIITAIGSLLIGMVMMLRRNA